MATSIASTTEVLAPEQVGVAAGRLAPYVHRTPVHRSRSLDEATGASAVYLKCENFQRIGAFKFRGAMHALLCLDEVQRQAGVITHSSGNHGQALAKAGQILGVPVCVVMPRTAPKIKRKGTEAWNPRIVTCEPTQQDRESTVDRLIAENGYTLVHPYDDWNVIAGQGTAAWEMIEQVEERLDLVMAPVGGGGLLSGTALAVQAKSPGTRVVAAEPQMADDAAKSFDLGQIIPVSAPRTMADGLRTSLGVRPFAVIQRYVEQIVTVSEREILQAMRFVWERFKILIEPSCAVPVAALMNGSVDVRGQTVGVIITGGNLDLDPLFDHLAATWLEDPQA